MCFMGILKNLLIAGFVLGNVNAMNQDNVQQDNNAQSDVVIFNNQASILACDCCFGKMIKQIEGKTKNGKRKRNTWGIA